MKYWIAVGLLAAIGVGAYVALRPLPAPLATVPATSLTRPSAASGPKECRLPGPAPVPPDARSATEAEMKLGHDAAQSFVLQLEAYQACLNDKIDHPAPGTTDQQKKGWETQGDEAVDLAHAIADAFSAQIKIFEARAKPK